MAMLSSYTTLLSQAPAPGKSSPAAALQLRSRQPAAASVVALRRLAASCKESRSRAALFVCHADNVKYGYNDIQPSALVHPREKNDGDWRLTDEKDQITLKFMVGETSKEKLEVATTEDQVLLVIRYKKKEDNDNSNAVVDDKSPASSLDVRLLMPPGYDSNKMQAMIFNGWLQIFIPKPKHEPKPIPISPPPP